MDNTENILIAFGEPVKALGDGKIGGYLVRFSTPKDPDMVGEFFTKETRFGTNMTPPLFYHHGYDGVLRTKQIGEGRWKFDDVGLWYEAQLEMADEYQKKIMEMVEQGKLGYSSGAMSHLVEYEQIGSKSTWIKTWIIGEASLTPTPAEPRNMVRKLKSILDDAGNNLLDIPDGSELEAEGKGEKRRPGAKQADGPATNKNLKEEIEKWLR